MLLFLQRISIEKENVMRGKKRVLTLAAIAMVALSGIVAGSAEKALAALEIEVNSTNFPDENFREYVAKWLDSDGNKMLSTKEIKEATRISINEQEIVSLQGVEFFTSLTELECSGNKLSKLNITKNKKLLKLDCSNNNLSTLDISKNTKLTDVKCSDNKLSKLSVTKNTKLVTLDCSNNKISKLSVTKNTELADLKCQNNKLSTLDVSKNTNLVTLNCADNTISKLTIKGAAKLDYLNVTNTKLTNLNLKNNTALSWLFCDASLKVTKAEKSKVKVVSY
jgi:Leucine-rich repeat (LRR) protein